MKSIRFKLFIPLTLLCVTFVGFVLGIMKVIYAQEDGLNELTDVYVEAIVESGNLESDVIRVQDNFLKTMIATGGISLDEWYRAHGRDRKD